MKDAKRIVVVGASSGLGRCIALGLAERGARVALLARRRERLVEAAAVAGRGAVAITCDVTDEQSCVDAIAEAAEALGGIDGVVYSTGTMTLEPLVDTTAETWARLFATNVTGAARVTAAALPHLSRSAGSAVYLSSVSASLTPPWPMLGAYATSKAALDKLVEAFRGEHPDVGFTRLAVGDCAGGEGDSQTEFVADQDLELLGTAIGDWMTRGYMNGNLIDPDHLVDTVEAILRCGASSVIPTISLTPRASAPQRQET
jgi:NAD(P)-dependent dehydrogenase (short-subunit alcohol dehydrogenase family)